MGWESRGNREYYYQKERVNGKVVSTYTGTGYVADLIARLEQGRRWETKFKAQKELENKQKDAEIEASLAEIEQEMNDLVEEFLINLGFYKTKSREWRYRNGR